MTEMKLGQSGAHSPQKSGFWESLETDPGAISFYGQELLYDGGHSNRGLSDCYETSPLASKVLKQLC